MAIQKVLVVDDSPTERFFITDLLMKAGYGVVQAENGEEALVKARTEKPQLIIMDVVMPGQNGYQITRTLSKDAETQHIPVIMCTTKGLDTDKVWGMRQGAREYVVKPVDATELLSKIRALPEAQS
ncbi:MAG: twitching motility two-component response regulator transcription regulator protein [Pseudomonadota bacterium]|jgi:twitching motility two-component system response regulator PilH